MLRVCNHIIDDWTEHSTTIVSPLRVSTTNAVLNGRLTMVSTDSKIFRRRRPNKNGFSRSRAIPAVASVEVPVATPAEAEDKMKRSTAKEMKSSAAVRDPLRFSRPFQRPFSSMAMGGSQSNPGGQFSQPSSTYQSYNNGGTPGYNWRVPLVGSSSTCSSMPFFAVPSFSPSPSHVFVPGYSQTHGMNISSGATFYNHQCGMQSSTKHGNNQCHHSQCTDPAPADQTSNNTELEPAISSLVKIITENAQKVEDHAKIAADSSKIVISSTKIVTDAIEKLWKMYPYLRKQEPPVVQSILQQAHLSVSQESEYEDFLDPADAEILAGAPVDSRSPVKSQLKRSFYPMALDEFF